MPFGINLIRRGDRLVAADAHAEAWIKETKEGKEVIVQGWRPRHPEFHRWTRCMLQDVADACGSRFADADDLLEALCEAVGHGRYITNLQGERRFVRRSTAFESMDQDRYKAFIDRCLHVINEVLGINPDELVRRVDAQEDGVYAKLQSKGSKK